MEPTIMECVMLGIMTVGAFIGLGALAVAVGEAEENRKHGRF